MNKTEIRRYPASDAAEKGVLGSILLAPARVLDELAWLGEEHFFEPVHRMIFNRMRTLQKEQISIDLLTLTQKMDDARELDEISAKIGCSGAAFLTDIFNFVPTASGAREYARILHEKLIWRRCIDVGSDLAEKGFSEYGPAENFLIEAQKTLADLTHNTTQNTIFHVSDITPMVADQIEAAYHSRGQITGLSVGLVDFDRMTLGLKGAQYVVIGARPSNGKTAFVTQALDSFARSGVPVGFFSLEMSKDQIVRRMVCSDVRANLYRAKDGFFTKEKFAQIADAIHKINGIPFYIDDSAGLTIYELRARARRMKEKFEIGAIGIDYVQCVKSTSKRAQESRVIEVAEVSMGIKEMTKELNIPVVVCAQLNRDAERFNARPKLADIKESGQIDADADLVALLHRPDKGNMRLKAKDRAADKDDKIKLSELEEELLRRELELIECIIVKQRDGAVGMEGLGFKPEFTRFESLTAKLYSNKPSERQKYGGRIEKPSARNGEEEEEYA